VPELRRSSSQSPANCLTSISLHQNTMPQATLRTQQGLVVLKQKRDPVILNVPQAGQVRIQKDWLKKSNEMYHKAIKQAMLVAAREVELVDAEDPLGGQAPANVASLKAKIKTIKAGQQEVNVAAARRKSIKKVAEGAERNKEKLIKFSSKGCSLANCNRRVRYFIIEQGEMKVYKINTLTAPLKSTYKLQKATFVVEEKMIAVAPKWEAGNHKQRLRVDVKERASPIYLYPQDEKQMKSWQKSFQLAKMLTADQDRRALKLSITRATCTPLVKAWEALFIYHKEVSSTKALVRQMSMRLMQADLSRGWMKLKFCFQKEKDQRNKSRAMRLKAASFMIEKLGRLTAEKGKTVADVRERVVTHIQERFRRYRDTMIFHRNYPLNAANISLVQQARAGIKLDLNMDALQWTEAIELLLDGQALADYKNNKELLRTQRPTYSEGPFSPTDTVNLFVSDNLHSLSFTRLGTGGFQQTGWSNFVSLDRISSVILHSEPFAGAKLIKDASQDKGVWCTINGPRIHWNQTTIPAEDDDPNSDTKVLKPSGVWNDRFALCEQLSSPLLKVHWLAFKITVKAASLKKSGNSMKTFCSLHAFGYKYTTTLEDGETPDFSKSTFQAQIPFPLHQRGDAKNLDTSLLLNSQICAEIFLSSDKLDRVADDENRTLYLVGSELMSKVLTPLEKLHEKGYKFNLKLPLGSPSAQPGSNDGSINIEMEPDTGPADDDPYCISPEFCGAGIPTNIFTSHRGAWYDPSKKLANFSMKHVANFIEISLRGLLLPQDDPADRPGQETTYRIRAALRGFSSVTQPMHRTRTNWQLILGSSMADPSVIKFNGCRLYLPIPPGCWSDVKEKGDAKGKRTIIVEVLKWKGTPQESEGRNFKNMKEYIESKGRQEKREPEIAAYKAKVLLDSRLIIDEDRSVTVFCSKASDLATPEIDVLTNQASNVLPDKSHANLSVDFALRDREYVKAALAKPENRRTICAGDKAMLMVEERLDYPRSEHEFNQRFYPGQYVPGQRGWGKNNGPAPLRDPCLTSEYQESGLSEMVPPFIFKQSFIPRSCHDVIPHKFILPLSEKEFLDRGLPGVWWRVLDNLAIIASQPIDNKNRSNLQHRCVQHLSHITRQVPVTVLAMYPNGTCDLELAPEFVQSWRKNPGAKLAMPGKLLPDPNARDENMRYILTNVPMMQLKAVHGAGINVYDAAFQTTQDLAKAAPPRNEFNPRTCPEEKADQQAKQQQRSASKPYSIACGPMPADASPAACKHEWSMHVRLQNEWELHHFVAMIRRCVRIDHYQQASKMLEYQNADTNKSATVASNDRPRTIATGGQLEILLVEARRLAHRADRANSSDQNIIAKVVTAGRINEKYLPNVTGTIPSGASVDCTPKRISMETFVNFRMKYQKETSMQAEGSETKTVAQYEVIPYKGRAFQQSPPVDGTDSPSWDFKKIGQARGHLFKTPMISNKIRDQLILEFEVWQKGLAGMQTSLGGVQLHFKHLIDLDHNKTFNNMWLSIGRVNEKERRYVVNDSGEVHIMARWIPKEKLQQLFDEQQQPLPVYSTFQQSIWKRICAPTIREPIYGLEALYIQYAPNVVKSYGAKTGNEPEKPKDQATRTVEQLIHTIPYLNCLERRQKAAWDEFKKQIVQETKQKRAPLAALRLSWVESRQATLLDQFQNLVERGIPSAYREELWSDLTLMKYVRDQGVRGWKPHDEAYTHFLQEGMSQKTEALHQLQEDSLNISAWESEQGELKDVHLTRVKRAKDVCTALLAIPKSGIAYCESLLVLAYYLLLPQGTVDTSAETHGQTQTQLKEHSEAWAFWILYTLIVPKESGAYVVYYGVSLPEDEIPVSAQNPQGQQQQRQPMKSPQLCAGGGALEDVQILGCCLMYHDRDLWNRMQALGFHMANTFYGMFMRLYATYMPTASVFRFWDLLFSQSTLHQEMVNPHARGHLIDLAFGVLMARKADLMLCESALEMHECILGMLGSLYDASTVIDMTMIANEMLWGITGFYNAKVGMAREEQEKLFKPCWVAIKKQNQLLKMLLHEAPFPALLGNQVRATNQNVELPAQGIGTKELLKYVLPKLYDSFEMTSQRKANQQPQRQTTEKFWAMHRPMPPIIWVASEDQVDKLLIYCSKKTQNPNGLPQQVPPATIVAPPKHLLTQGDRQTFAEPNGIDATAFVEILRNDLDPSWQDFANKMWNEFKSGGEVFGAVSSMSTKNNNGTGALSTGLSGFLTQASTFLSKPDYNDLATNTSSAAGKSAPRVSFNELYIAMICASKGTVGEKAGALFNIYCQNDPMRSEESRHRTPISRIAVTQSRAMDMADETGHGPDRLKRNSPESKNYALRFTVKTKMHGGRILGHVYIPSLSQYYSMGIANEESRAYDIWGEVPVNGKVSETLVLIGEMDLAIAWTPTALTKPEIGQLTIKLSSVTIYETYNSDFWTLNPYVEVESPAGASKDFKPIQRGHIHKRGSWIGDTGAFGEHIKFEESKVIGHFVQGLFHSRQGMGFDQRTKQWRWNEEFGQMSSIESWQCHPDFVKTSTSRKSMDMAGVRIIVQSIFSRCMLNLTNRQAIQIADAAFNSHGVVPGILKVLLVGGEPSSYLGKSWKELEEAKVGTDVTAEIVAEHEKQIAENGGFLTLFRNEHMAFKKEIKQALNLRDMKIKGLGKISFLAVRYIQAGDGERLWKPVSVDKNGNIMDNSEILFDDGADRKKNNRVNKEEFISCMMASPLISEALRRLGHCETFIPQRPMRLDVEIMDPHKLDDTNRFVEEVNAEHSILLEVWDADLFSKDFLGECWLPPLSTLGPVEKQFVLPLKKADYTEFAEPWPSRKDDAKEIKATTATNAKVTGDLYVSVSWTFPIDVGKEIKGESVEERARMQEALHAGRLSLVIKRASGLRLSDAQKGRKCDPLVTVWKRNDRTGAFGLKPWCKTSSKNNTDKPVWNFTHTGIIHIEDKEEERHGMFDHMFESRKERDRKEYDKNVGVLNRQVQHVRINFNDTGRPGQKDGEHHSHLIYFSDTIREFKNKLEKACEDEAYHHANIRGDAAPESAMYRDIKIHHQHLVMVFIPSREVHRLFTEGRMKDKEYVEAYDRAKKDPSNWQPLDPAMTFAQYPQFFKQRAGNGPLAEIRVLEATEAYKLVNLRYKNFDKSIRPPRVQDVNEWYKCYAMGKYVHKDGSTEWRPCHAELARGKSRQSASNLTIKWLHDPSCDQQLGTDEVILVPRCPQIEDTALDEDVRQVLEQARGLRSCGKSDWDIVDILNRQLQKRWNEDDSSKKEKASMVTVDIVQAYLHRAYAKQQDLKKSSNATKS